MSAGTFLLGLGGQKCGTTWLHRYLSTSVQSDFGIVKEYHVLDSHFSQSERNFYYDRLAELSGIVGQGEINKKKRLEALTKLSAFTQDLRLYFDYFGHLLDSAEETCLTGDLTPSNSVLAKNQMEIVRDNFAKMGVDVKAIQLVRDPVERIISSTRHRFRDQNVNPTQSEEIYGILNDLDSVFNEVRSRYDRVDSSAREVFGDNYKLVFFEDLFQESTLRDICDFLSIDFVEFDAGKKENVSRTDNTIPDEARRAVALKFKEVYTYISGLIGSERATELWNSYRFFDHPTAERDLQDERLLVVGGVQKMVAIRDAALAERDAVIADRDAVITERDQVIAERDEAIAERNKAVDEIDRLQSELQHIKKYPWKHAKSFFERK